MNLLMIAEADPVLLEGGAERMLQQYSHRLAARGHSVTVLTRRLAPALAPEETVGGVRVVRHPVSPRGSLGFAASLVRECGRAVQALTAEARFDLAILFQPLSAAAFHRAAAGSGLPSLYCFLSPWADEYRVRRGLPLEAPRREPFLKPWLSLNTGARRWTERRAIAAADRFFALSDFSLGQLHRIHGLTGDGLRAIPGGVDTHRFVPLAHRAELRERLHLPPGPLLLTVRNLEPRMGLDNLLGAWAAVRERYPDAHLLIGGTGPIRRELEAMAAALGLAGTVTFTGFIAEEELPLYYAAADCFVIPTRALEGFGLVTVEALACGTPVLGTSVGATTEILTSFNPRFLFRDVSPEAIAEGILDRLPEILGDMGLRRRCRDFAVRHYDWDVVIDRLEALLREVVHEHSCRTPFMFST
jgi:glycosyltransferase involved in cell wall biosynthesis